MCMLVCMALFAAAVKRAFEGSKPSPKIAGKRYLFRLSCLQSCILKAGYVNVVLFRTHHDGILFVFILGLEL